MTPTHCEPTILLAGCGYTLQAVAKRLTPGSFVATSRSPETVQKLQARGFHSVVLELGDVSTISAAFRQFPQIRKIVDGIPPARQSEPDRYVDNLLNALENVPVEAIIYLSTTGVFGERGGAWVDETSTPKPWHPQGQARLRCEERYRSSRIPSCSLRIPAIYGPGRGLESALRSGAYRLIDDGGSWTNRIHVEDLADVILTLLLEQPDRIPSLLCVNDDAPTRQIEIVRETCARLSLPLPNSITSRQAEERGNFTMLSNQRVANTRMKALLGRGLRYPSFLTEGRIQGGG
jgi:nucleoside-diphosphate-sugar epimerase